jgi:hypothetical protein
MDRAGIFHRLPHLDDSRLAEIFAREVLRLLVGKGLLSAEWAERILSWRHTGFNVHSRVRARTKTEADRKKEIPIINIRHGYNQATFQNWARLFT